MSLLAVGLERRLVVLMAARLVLSLLSLGIALTLDALGYNTVTGWNGFYATVTLAFLATVGFGVVLHRIRRQRRFAALNIATDIAIVSALVLFSGGNESVFTFLYLLVAFYGAVLFERPGALLAASLSALAYGSVLVAGAWDPLSGSFAGISDWPPLLMHWALHAGAVVLVAALASFLAGELRRSDEALQQRTHDLQRLQSFHRRIVDSLMSGLLTTDDSGCVTSFNPEAERITGLSARAAAGRDLETVLPGAREAVLGPVGDVRNASARARIVYWNEEGAERHLGLGGYVLRDDAGAAAGYVVIFQDVTEIVAMEEDLRRSERLAAIGELSASIAHEIRNPLAAISGAIQMLNRPDDAKDEEAGRLMDIAIREADRLNHLITDFLRYARPGPMRPQRVELAEVVDEVVDLFGAGRPEGVQLELAMTPGLTVCADPGQLRQVLWNLVRNAAEAMPEGGRLQIRAGESDGSPQDEPPGLRNGRTKESQWVEISVVDEGVGIPPDVLKKIFEPFYTTKPDGSGLGLATVHRIVEEHGGSVRLESTVGSGTTVWLRLPKASR